MTHRSSQARLGTTTAIPNRSTAANLLPLARLLPHLLLSPPRISHLLLLEVLKRLPALTLTRPRLPLLSWEKTGVGPLKRYLSLELR